MRLFTGIDVPAAVKDNLTALIERLRPAARIRWSPLENLHITTKFIGEWPQGQVEELAGALRKLPTPAPFEISVRGLGWFPNPHSPRVLWAAVKAPPVLEDLAVRTDQVLALAGVAPETRPFSPHLTLARIKEPVPLAALRQAIAALGSDEFGRFTAASFHLYLSERGPGGSVYTKLADFPLSGQ